MASVKTVIQPPPFLEVAGKPLTPWNKWFRVFENYLEAIDATKYSPSRERALLFNHLGSAGQEVFDNLPVFPAPTGDETWNVFKKL